MHVISLCLFAGFLYKAAVAPDLTEYQTASDFRLHPATVSRRNGDRKQVGKEIPACLSSHLSVIITAQ